MSCFSKCVTVEFSSGKVYWRNGTIVYKVWPKACEGWESKPMSDFPRFLNSRITLWDVSSLNYVSLNTQTNFCFRTVLSEAHEAESLLLIKYFSTSFRSIFISLKKAYLRERTILYKVWRKVIRVGESESAVSFSNFPVEKIPLKKTYSRKRTIPYKVWWKAIEVGESESAVSFPKFLAQKISLKKAYLRKRTIFYFF